MALKKRIVRGVVFSLLISVAFQALPISERTAKVVPVVGGAAVGVGTGLLSHFVILNKFASLKNNTTERALISAILGLGVGALTWWGLDYLLAQFTPRGKCLAAHKIIKLIEADEFINREFSSPEDLIGAVNMYFGTSWPLVLAREHLTTTKNSLIQAAELIRDAKKEALQDPACLNICQKCNVLESKLLPLQAAIERKMVVLVEHKDYLDQMKIYEKHMEEERRRFHEQRMRDEERWHKNHEHDKEREFQREEKEKDRRFKERVLIDNHRPVTVMI